MLIKLIKKEFKLCTHPTVWIFLTFALCVFIPNYPYEIMYFFSTLGTFYCCLQCRENGDLTFGATLPVAKEQLAVAKIVATIILQCAAMALVSVVVTVKCVFSGAFGMNAAGMEATYATVGFGGVILGIFNITFFPIYFKNPQKVGVPYLVSAVPVALMILLTCVLSYVPPFSMLDTAGFTNIAYKMTTLAVGVVVYAILSVVAVMMSVQRFRRVDL